MVYVITAATSQTGSAAAEKLLKDGHSVRAIVRSEEKGQHLKSLGAEIAIGDVTDVASLVKAFTGATAVYVMNPPDYQSNDFLASAEEVSATLFDAIQTSKVPKVVALSSVGSEHPTGTGPIRTTNILERHLSKVDCQIIFLRPGYFMENWKPVVGLAKEKGILPSANTVDKKIPMVTTNDIGTFIAKYLVSETKDKIINIAGPVEFSSNDVAAAFTSALGKTVNAVPIPDEQLDSHFGAFFKPKTAAAFTEMSRGLNTGFIAFKEGSKVERGQTGIDKVVASWV